MAKSSVPAAAANCRGDRLDWFRQIPGQHRGHPALFQRTGPSGAQDSHDGRGRAGLAYVATGRFDAYIERGIRLWDIAAGGLIVECAGGEFWRRPIPGEHAYRMVATNGLLRRALRVPG